MYDRTTTDLNCCVQIGKNEHLFRTTSKLEGESGRMKSVLIFVSVLFTELHICLTNANKMIYKLRRAEPLRPNQKEQFSLFFFHLFVHFDREDFCCRRILLILLIRKKAPELHNTCILIFGFTALLKHESFR